MTSETAPLPSKPFNHLSVLAYLAIGIVVFASSVVTGYLVHSCYRSASRKDALDGSLAIASGDVEAGAGYRRATSRRDRGEVELKPLVREFDDEGSSLSDSRTVIAKMSPDKGTFANAALQLVYSSDSTVAPSSCRMPSPSSPSPALYKQTRQYAELLPYSPVSPSPAFFCGGPPPSMLIPYDERDWYTEQQTSSINAKAKGSKRQAPRPSTQFDSNNIRYIPQLEPCVTESTVKFYKEPKLSPVHGSIFPPSPGDSRLCPSHVRQPSFSQDPSSTNSTPILVSQKRAIRVISGDTGPAVVLPRLPESHHTENMDPISSRRVDQHPREPILPIVRLKPGPGYF